MNEKHPNRKKDKHNPYTLMIVEGRYKGKSIPIAKIRPNQIQGMEKATQYG